MISMCITKSSWQRRERFKSFSKSLLLRKWMINLSSISKILIVMVKIHLWRRKKKSWIHRISSITSLRPLKTMDTKVIATLESQIVDKYHTTILTMNKMCKETNMNFHWTNKYTQALKIPKTLRLQKEVFSKSTHLVQSYSTPKVHRSLTMNQELTLIASLIIRSKMKCHKTLH